MNLNDLAPKVDIKLDWKESSNGCLGMAMQSGGFGMTFMLWILYLNFSTSEHW